MFVFKVQLEKYSATVEQPLQRLEHRSLRAWSGALQVDNIGMSGYIIKWSASLYSKTKRASVVETSQHVNEGLKLFSALDGTSVQRRQDKCYDVYGEG